MIHQRIAPARLRLQEVRFNRANSDGPSFLGDRSFERLREERDLDGVARVSW